MSAVRNVYVNYCGTPFPGLKNVVDGINEEDNRAKKSFVIVQAFWHMHGRSNYSDKNQHAELKSKQKYELPTKVIEITSLYFATGSYFNNVAPKTDVSPERLSLIKTCVSPRRLDSIKTYIGASLQMSYISDPSKEMQQYLPTSYDPIDINKLSLTSDIVSTVCEMYDFMFWLVCQNCPRTGLFSKNIQATQFGEYLIAKTTNSIQLYLIFKLRVPFDWPSKEASADDIQQCEIYDNGIKTLKEWYTKNRQQCHITYDSTLKKKTNMHRDNIYNGQLILHKTY